MYPRAGKAGGAVIKPGFFPQPLKSAALSGIFDLLSANDSVARRVRSGGLGICGIELRHFDLAGKANLGEQPDAPVIGIVFVPPQAVAPETRALNWRIPIPWF